MTRRKLVTISWIALAIIVPGGFLGVAALALCRYYSRAARANKNLPPS